MLAFTRTNNFISEINNGVSQMQLPAVCVVSRQKPDHDPLFASKYLVTISKETRQVLFRQFVTRFSQLDWFLDVLKISTDARQ